VLKRVVVPDSHGCFIDPKAAKACLDIIRKVKPDEIVHLGDAVDASGIFSKFAPQYVREKSYSYKNDIDAARAFLTDIGKSAPSATKFFLYGNHEDHAERFIAATFASRVDAEMAMPSFDPAVLLGLKELGYFCLRRSEQHGGMATRGVLSLEGCHFAHGLTACVHAASKHLDIMGDSIAFGHTHRAQMLTKRRPNGLTITAQCPGTLAKLNPLYQHGTPNTWSHGVGLQFVDRGQLHAFNIPIINGKWFLT
jgi:predicted phosphodiesterase